MTFFSSLPPDMLDTRGAARVGTATGAPSTLVIDNGSPAAEVATAAMAGAAGAVAACFKSGAGTLIGCGWESAAAAWGLLRGASLARTGALVTRGTLFADAGRTVRAGSGCGVTVAATGVGWLTAAAGVGLART